MRKVIVITGASRGIGAATALLAAKKDYDAICINYHHNIEAANEIANQIKALGKDVITVAADISQEQSVKDLFCQVDEKLGPITALVNNAGILDKRARLDAISAERLNRIFSTNIMGSFLCAKEAIKRMSTRYGGQGGSIVNVSSTASRFGSPGDYIDYAASKGAIDTFTIGLAQEVAAENIRVNAVRPGFIYTDIHADSGSNSRVDDLKSSLPMLRGGMPEEVAEAIIWLLSDAASYTSRTFIDVSGAR
ncbi:MAG: NAD(P)-dependent oxidoreductase [Legionellales bacterium]|nr:NAD(P)-dependent oxidoreductase [Legionellales bacterium]|tara:strand:- start:232 stop:981 length:750 start_codon:yes stop_codon:yes gene_type:complete